MKRVALMQDESPKGDTRMLGAGLLLLGMAWVCGESRDFVPSLFARQVVAKADVTVLNERDDSRMGRAFSQAREGPSSEAWLEPLPKEHRDITKATVWVSASNSQEVLDKRDRIIEAMRSAFNSDGPGDITFNHNRATRPVPNDTTVLAGRLMRGGAMLFLLLGVGALLLFWRKTGRKFFEGAPKTEPVVKLMTGYLFAILVLSLGFRDVTLPFLPRPLNLPSSWVLIMLVMAIPVLIITVMITKMREVSRAVHWRTGSARITRSETRSERHRHVGDVSKVTNVAAVEYEFDAGGKTCTGSRISIGETMGPEVQAAMKRYRVGATVPVYYDPADPGKCVLERDAPASAGCMAAIAVGLVAAGLCVVVFFLSPDGFEGALSPWFPKGAHPIFAIFFGVASLMTLMAQLGSQKMARMAANWPRAQGRVVRSETESYYDSTGDRSPRRLLYEPVVEYAFNVDGKEYHSTQLKLGGKLASSMKGMADKVVERYPVGQPVEVRYDPGNPTQSVVELQVGHLWLGYGLVIVLAVAAAFFGGAFGSR